MSGGVEIAIDKPNVVGQLVCEGIHSGHCSRMGVSMVKCVLSHCLVEFRQSRRPTLDSVELPVTVDRDADYFKHLQSTADMKTGIHPVSQAHKTCFITLVRQSTSPGTADDRHAT